jgi:hypothetical protein
MRIVAVSDSLALPVIIFAVWLLIRLLLRRRASHESFRPGILKPFEIHA